MIENQKNSDQELKEAKSLCQTVITPSGNALWWQKSSPFLYKSETSMKTTAKTDCWSWMNIHRFRDSAPNRSPTRVMNLASTKNNLKPVSSKKNTNYSAHCRNVLLIQKVKITLTCVQGIYKAKRAAWLPATIAPLHLSKRHHSSYQPTACSISLSHPGHSAPPNTFHQSDIIRSTFMILTQV